jgi:mono/diheme cytochrome c family protein
MKHLKLALLSSAFALLALACTGDNTTTNTGDISRANTASSPVASASPTPSPTPDEFAAARTAYNAACIRCHKDNGEGGQVELDEKTKLKVPSFKEGHGLTHTDQQFARQIANGGDGMPAFKNRLSPEQIDELVRFIRREFQAGLLKPGASPAH